MALIAELKDFLSNPPYISLIFEKELRLKNPREVKNKLMGIIESTGADVERTVLEEVSGKIFEDEGKSFYLIIDSSGKYILKRILLPGPELVDYDNFPSMISYLNYEFWFEKAYLCIVERKLAEIWMVEDRGLLFVDLLKEDIPKRVRYGGLLGFEENRIRRHVEHHEKNYLKDLKDTLDGLMKANGVSIAVLGVRDSFKDEVLSVFTEKERFIFSEIGTDEDKEEKFRKALQAVRFRSFEIARSRVESSHPKPVKPEDLVKKLSDGEAIAEVFVSAFEDLKKIRGFYCPLDLFLNNADGKCVFCDNRMLLTSNILDAALFKSYLKGTKVSFVDLGYPGIYIFG